MNKKVLVVNAGSGSLKYQVIEFPSEKVLASGYVERIGNSGTFDTLKINGVKNHIDFDTKNHDEAVLKVLENLVKYGVIKSFDEISGVGHRVVQGGKYFADSAVVDADVLKKVEELCVLAPLHNPSALTVYKSVKKYTPNVKHVFVFDTAFHQSIPSVNKMYALPKDLREKYAIQKYGAHGTSHKYVTKRVAELMGVKDLTNFKVISCHLGTGASISAVKGGKCVNTTMGFTPLGGLPMGTRSGDLDPSVVLTIMEKENLSPEQMRTLLNKESGFKGMCGLIDARDIEKGINEGNQDCLDTYNHFVKKIADFIGSYYVELGGCDALLFTAGIGENGPLVRKMVVDLIGPALNVKIDEEANNCRGVEKEISTKDSKVKVFIIPTNEELEIARDVVRLVG